MIKVIEYLNKYFIPDAINPIGGTWTLSNSDNSNVNYNTNITNLDGTECSYIKVRINGETLDYFCYIPVDNGYIGYEYSYLRTHKLLKRIYDEKGNVIHSGNGRSTGEEIIEILKKHVEKII